MFVQYLSVSHSYIHTYLSMRNTALIWSLFLGTGGMRLQ